MICACYLSTLDSYQTVSVSSGSSGLLTALRLRIFLLQGLISDISTCRLRTAGLGEGDSCIPRGQLYCSQQIRSWDRLSGHCFVSAEPECIERQSRPFVLLEYLKIFKFNSYFIVLCTGRSLENRDRDLQMKSFIYLFFTRNLEDFVDAVLKV